LFKQEETVAHTKGRAVSIRTFLWRMSLQINRPGPQPRGPGHARPPRAGRRVAETGQTRTLWVSGILQ